MSLTKWNHQNTREVRHHMKLTNYHVMVTIFNFQEMTSLILGKEPCLSLTNWGIQEWRIAKQLGLKWMCLTPDKMFIMLSVPFMVKKSRIVGCCLGTIGTLGDLVQQIRRVEQQSWWKYHVVWRICWRVVRSCLFLPPSPFSFLSVNNGLLHTHIIQSKYSTRSKRSKLRFRLASKTNNKVLQLGSWRIRIAWINGMGGRKRESIIYKSCHLHQRWYCRRW